MFLTSQPGGFSKNKEEIGCCLPLPYTVYFFSPACRCRSVVDCLGYSISGAVPANRVAVWSFTACPTAGVMTWS